MRTSWTPAKTDTPEPDLATNPTLSGLLRSALSRNPRIAAARMRAEAAGEGASAEGWLPDPEVMVGWYESPVRTAVGEQEWSLELPLAQSPVGHRVPGVGNQLLEAGHGVIDRLNPIVDIENLAFSQDLASNGGRHRRSVVGPDVGENRMAILGRRANVADVPDAG